MHKQIPKYVTLNSGQKMPTFGLGTYRINQDNNGVEVVYKAIMEQGVRHIDTASRYQTESQIGQAIQQAIQNGIKREELFITTKLWLDDKNKAEESLKKSLQQLQLDYVDCYLIHWPFQYEWKDDKAYAQKVPLHILWNVLENCVDKGLTKSIGVSNFNCQLLIDLLTYCRIKPVCNQIELHPYLVQKDLVDWMKSVDIQPVGYAAIGSVGRSDEKGQEIIIENSYIKELAKKYNKTPAQIILNWGVSRGHVVLAKSNKQERIKENISIYNFQLEKNEIENINKLDKNQRHFDIDSLNFSIKYPIFK